MTGAEVVWSSPIGDGSLIAEVVRDPADSHHGWLILGTLDGEVLHQLDVELHPALETGVDDGDAAGWRELIALQGWLSS